MKYEFTTDANFITWCMTLPEVWRMGTDDSAIGVDRRMFYVNPEGNFWLQCDKYGLLMCEPIPQDAFKLHVAFAANAKGKADRDMQRGVRVVIHEYRCNKFSS